MDIIEKITTVITPLEEVDKINEIIQNLNNSGGGSGGSNLLVGQTILSLDPLNDARLHLYDGSLLLADGTYDVFISNYIIPLYNSNPSRFTTEEDWQSTVLECGVCDKYVYTPDVSVRLPKLGNKLYSNIPNDIPSFGNGFTLAVTDGTSLAGMNATTGTSKPVQTMTQNFGKTIGASYGTTNLKQLTIGVPTKEQLGDNLEFSGLIADTSNINDIEVYYYVVVATGNTPLDEATTNINNIVTDLNAKADVDLTNVPANKGILTESYSNGTSWYRVYSDGWCEQGGQYVVTSGSNNRILTASLLKDFKDTNYTVIGITAFAEGVNTEYKNGIDIRSRSTVSFNIGIGFGEAAAFIWQASGYIN